MTFITREKPHFPIAGTPYICVLQKGQPWCFTIAPAALENTLETIRNAVAHEIFKFFMVISKLRQIHYR